MQLQSESIGDLVAALVKAQAKMQHAVKDRTNPHFKNDYATLESVIDATRAPLAEQGLIVVQQPSVEDGQTVLVTTLAHSSGQWMRSVTPILSERNNAQGLGSGLSYSRRYALAAITNISQTDDDAEQASAPAKDNVSPFAKTGFEGYVVPFGKYKGRKLVELDAFDVRNYCEFIVKTAESEARSIEGPVKVFLETSDAWLATRGNR